MVCFVRCQCSGFDYSTVSCIWWDCTAVRPCSGYTTSQSSLGNARLAGENGKIMLKYWKTPSGYYSYDNHYKPERKSTLGLMLIH